MDDKLDKSDASSTDDVIEVKSFISKTPADLRRTSFLLSATEIAQKKYHVSRQSIFLGGL